MKDIEITQSKDEITVDKKDTYGTGSHKPDSATVGV